MEKFFSWVFDYNTPIWVVFFATAVSASTAVAWFFITVIAFESGRFSLGSMMIFFPLMMAARAVWLKYKADTND